MKINEKEIDDKTIRRIYKLQRLAERGVPGEKESAQKKLNTLLLENGFESFEELEQAVGSDCKNCTFYYDNRYELKILRQCIYKVMGAENNPKLYQLKSRSNIIVIKCTEWQRVEIQLEFYFYKKLFREEMNHFLAAFIQKQNIFPEDAPKGTYKESDIKIYNYAKNIDKIERIASIGSNDCKINIFDEDEVTGMV